MKIIYLKGLPASGKSTWAKDYCSKYKGWVRVNRDDLRHMRGEYWLPKKEGMITDWEDSLIEVALESGSNVIVDATNLNEGRVKSRYLKLKKVFPHLKLDIKFFDTPLEECIERDKIRPNSVGKDVIMGMYDKYLREKLDYIQDINLPKCVIFDIDGTLATKSGRSPYDWDRVKEDTPNSHVVKLVSMYKNCGYRIIVFTGRDGSCYDLTREWLTENDIPFDELYSRVEGDCRKDSIVKREMFDSHVYGRYFCEVVYDDRDQVVEMWRKDLGLNCLQVNYGNF